MLVTRPTPRKRPLQSRFARLLAGSALVILPTGVWAQAAAPEDCALVQGRLPSACDIGNAGRTVGMPYAPNAEQDGRAPSLSGDGFAITIGDGGQGTRAAAQPDRNADQALEDADIQVRYDGLYAERRLNVATEDLRSAFRPGETVSFRASSNYPGQIARAEVRITAQSEGFGLPQTTVVPIPANGTAGWAMPAGDTDSYTYVLRVYDADDRFDETVPLPLDRRTNPAMPVLNDPVIAAGEGEDRTARRNIPAGGGVVTVSGAGLPANATVTVMGQDVPVDADGRFVTQRLMPFGTHDVSVDLSAPGARGVVIEREVVIPRSDWFYAGIADFTLSKRGTTVGNGVVRKEGRLAFYAKGTIDGQTRITASADTGEGDIDRLFDDFFDKSPRSLLDRIDPDDLYPTYGDDSRIVDDAPTSGRIYLRVERGDSHVMWGDFRNEIDGTRFVNTARNLYGAQAVYRSPGSTDGGERRAELSFYAASPDSLPQRDELRGTGGSAYFLKRQDIVPGTETIRVDTVDPVSRRVIATKQLVAGQDYRIDYIQGTVILTNPLSSSTGSGSVVSGGAGGSYDVNLVAQYEYETTGAPLEGASFGGRIETWLPGDRVRVGLTGMDETTDTADLQVLGADARVTFGQASYLEAEVAQSEGIGFGRSISTDGGLSFVDLPSVASIGAASAYRIEGVLDLGDVIAGGEGTITAYAERKEAGFKTLSEDIAADTRLWGVDAAIRLSPRTDLRLAFRDFDETGGESRLEGTADIGYLLSDGLKAEVGIRYLDATDPASAADTGTRSDLGFRLTRTFDDETALYGFAQATLDRTGGLARNDRAGIGGKFRLSETVTAEGEISDGTSGLGARAILGYKPSDDARYYLGYELDPDREVAGQTLNGRDGGTLILGAERQLGAATSIFAENNYDMFGQRRSLTSAYGVTYTPDSVWKFSAGIEAGTVRDAFSGDFDRTAASFGFTYDDGDSVTGKLRAEARVEDAANPAQDRRTYLLAGSYGYQVSPDWRAIATLDALISDSDQSAFLDGRYVETSLGFAYRPVANDRLNALAKYTYLYDLPGNDQVNAGGSASGDKQRSHILSLDAIYELGPTWEIGGKLAYRSSETAPRTGGAFTDNDAALAALRATYHLVHEWDISGEIRTLVLPSADQQEWGVVASAYKHVGNNVKVGVGFNFGQFSDDLTDTTLDDRGLFLNVVGKF